MAADHSHAPHGSHSTAVYDSHGEAHQEEHHHPTWKTYRWVALILTLITIVEVWIYYTPFKENRLFAPALLAMSAAKFIIVVLFYMHLKYDARLFKALFSGPLIVAISILISLLFLFGHLAIRT